MNVMSIYKWALGLCLLFVPGAYLCADSIPAYTCNVTNESIRLNRGRVSISFTMDLGKNAVSRQHRRVITPVIRTADYSRTLELAPVVVTGHNRAIKDLRSGDARNTCADAYACMVGKESKRRYVEYRVEADWYPWMEQAVLALHEEVEGCACGGLMDNERIVADHLLYTPRLIFSAERKCPETYDVRTKSCDAFLIYPVDRTTLFPQRYGNSRELAKIDSVLTAIERNPAYGISHIDIAGFASPEGTLKHNMDLAEGRSQALKEYICRRYAIADTLMSVSPGGENWDGLQQLLQQMQLPYKDEVLKAISSVSDLDRREEAIKAIGEGMPYRVLLTTVYPLLRKNTFRISYFSRERTPEEAKQMVFSHPEELNVYEFYKVARTFYADDAEKYGQVLTIAADSHPEHSIANYNAAVIALKGNRTDRAESYLQHTMNECYTWNTRACLLWKQGREEEAIVWWKKAAKAGDHEAELNLAEVEKRGR